MSSPPCLLFGSEQPRLAQLALAFSPPFDPSCYTLRVSSHHCVSDRYVRTVILYTHLRASAFEILFPSSRHVVACVRQRQLSASSAWTVFMPCTLLIGATLATSRWILGSCAVYVHATQEAMHWPCSERRCPQDITLHPFFTSLPSFTGRLSRLSLQLEAGSLCARGHDSRPRAASFFTRSQTALYGPIAIQLYPPA